MLLWWLMVLLGIAYLGRYVITILTGRQPGTFPFQETIIPVVRGKDGTACTNVSVTYKGEPVEVMELIHRKRSNRKYDVVFLIDNSGSMLGHAQGISKSINRACDDFTKSGADIQLAGVYFGTTQDVCFPTQENDYQKFKDWLSGSGLTNVSAINVSAVATTQDSLELIPESAFRLDAKRVFITVADGDNHPGNIGLTRTPQELNQAYPDAMWISITTPDNKAKHVSDVLKGLHMDLPSTGNLDLRQINFARLVTADTIARIRYRLPRGKKRLVVTCTDTNLRLNDVIVHIR
jgi:hypothetical protein